MRKTTLMILALTALASRPSKAQMRLVNETHRGNGCPVNSVAFATSPDGQAVSVLYQNFSVQLPDPNQGQIPGSTVRRRFDPFRLNRGCNLSFDIELSAGVAVESLEVSIFNRGAAIMDAGVRGSVSTTFLGYSSFGGRVAPQSVTLQNKAWSGAVNDDWISNPVVTVPIRSACASASARTMRFDMLSAIDAQIVSGNPRAQALITMDSSDVNGSMKIRVITRPCGGRSAPR